MVRLIAVATTLLLMTTSSVVRADWITDGVFSERSGIDSIERFLVLSDTVLEHDFGKSTICLGDISGDGIDDILVIRSPRILTLPAYSYILLGSLNPTGDSEAELIGPRAGAASVGDLNGDGFIDIGSYYVDSNPAFHVFFWGPEYDDVPDIAFTYALFLDPRQATDLDDDGILELPISTSMNGGPVHIYKAAPDLDTVPDYVIADTAKSFGSTLATGDINGDHYADLVVSAFRNRDTSLIKFYWGGPDFDTAADYVLRSTKLRLGEIMEPLGDFNGDGYEDLLICGSTNEPYGIYFGGPEFDDTIDVVINWRGGYYVPTWADVAGDVNNDGYPDLVVGYDYGEEVNLYLGGPDIDSVMIADVYLEDFLMPGQQDDFGYYVAGIGDFNGDGADDFVALSRTYYPDWVGEINFFAGWNGSGTDVEHEYEPGLPSEYQLYQNYPNPFNLSTTITFELPRKAVVHLTVHDVLGRTVATLAGTEFPAGMHRMTWDGRAMGGDVLPSGLYLYQLKTGDYVQSRKMLLVK